ncbi:hypothetical protein BSKO_01048 [Bryopsis sp. KO-2023]|nr:hypothetical protein BSKO_01048 [Bryopsis sp. KO-2023]
MGAELFGELQKEGWHIKPQVQGALLQELDTLNVHLLRQHLLNSDFKKVGHVCIPDAVNKANATFQGPVVLQVSSARDITRPEKGVASDGGKRMMFLTLTDGRSTCRCLEYKQVSSLSDAMAPGTKIVLRNATVKAGVIILDTKSIQVLGGRVDDLAEAWEIERKFGASRPKGDDEEMAPAFKHFDPRRTGRHNKGQSRGAGATPPVGPSAAAILSGQTEEEEEEVVRQVDVSAGSAPISSNQSAVKAKLLGDMKPDLGRRPYRNQGFGGPQDSSGPSTRGGRGGRHGQSRGDDPSTLTLEEYEARKKRGTGLLKPTATVQSDEELARKLHEELNMTASSTPPPAPPQRKSAANELLSNLFSYGGDPEPEFDPRGGRGGRGRGRGHVGSYEGRGGRGPSRGRGGPSRSRGRGRGGGGGRRGRRG